ncbi:hypothetical protein [Streptomyces sp. NPDC024089]|uniref:DUF6896 domain-containing protein n=1 Tax=Streptomyces sp. NPDC024089 TaxID=3154328 RepID=UPI0033F233CC
MAAVRPKGSVQVRVSVVLGALISLVRRADLVEESRPRSSGSGPEGVLRKSENDDASGDQVLAAQDLVLAFVGALGAARAAVRMSVPSLGQLADLLTLTHSGEISRRGEAGGHSYAVHGVGCRLAGPDGVDIDVDFAADGTEIFDFWRLRLFGRSLPTPVDPAAEDLRSAVEALDDVLTEVRPGWFTVSGAPRGAFEGRAVHSDPG